MDLVAIFSAFSLEKEIASKSPADSLWSSTVRQLGM